MISELASVAGSQEWQRSRLQQALDPEDAEESVSEQWADLNWRTSREDQRTIFSRIAVELEGQVETDRGQARSQRTLSEREWHDNSIAGLDDRTLRR